LDLTGTKALLRHANDLWLYDFARGHAARLTDTPGEAELDATLAPTGDRAAFVRENDLFAARASEDGKALPPARLTTDGSARLLNGRLDWVYEEEVYGRGNTTGYAWSPDGKNIAFLQLDETPVRPVALLDARTGRPGSKVQLYPRAGTPNPVARLAVVSSGGGSPPRFVDLSAYPEADRLLVRFTFSPDSRRVLFQVQNRAQTFLHLIAADPETGKVTRLVEEKTPAWVDVLGQPRFLSDGSFLWASERSGMRHLYRYKADGTPLGPVTKGEWEVRDFYGVDETGGWVYVGGTEAANPLSKHVFRVRLDGAGERVRLTRAEGEHSAAFDPSLAYFTDTWSDLHTPPQLRLHAARDGAPVRTLAENGRVLSRLAPYRLSRPEIVSVKMRDGFPLNAILIRPERMEEGRRYPVFCPVYGGPNSSLFPAATCRNAWGAVEPWYYYLAQQGIAVWIFDNRSASSGRGARAVWTVYKDLGAGELRDIEDGVAWLRGAQAWVDPGRIGIYGWSYGGFLAAYALTHGDVFKVGIAGAGVMDWRLYDTIYTERYLGTPDANPEGYRRSAVIEAAANLSGSLLLIHGAEDDNVHLENTLRLARALRDAGKPYELALVPRSRHGVTDPTLYRQMRQQLTDFLLKNL
ncbi:MAG TPA: S9 family peptidase, partial [Armatimonadaceae bacterium]|nr:S9 family peptidase [Armatimonadaceae bacterium]